MRTILGTIPFLLGLLTGQTKMIEAFHWPGMEPVPYCTRSDAININSACKPMVNAYVNRLTSQKSLLSHEYHDFDFCLADESYPPILNLGQQILGDRIKPSPVNIEFLKDVHCSTICQKDYIGGDKDSEQRLTKLKKAIRMNYKHHWLMDSIPVTFCRQLNSIEMCTEGFDVGNYFNMTSLDAMFYFINNHFSFEIIYTSGAEEEWGVGFGKSIARIVAVKVTLDDFCGKHSLKSLIPDVPLEDGQKLSIIYKYSVKFVRNDTIKWSDRWNLINVDNDQTICWFSIFETLLFVVIFTVWTCSLVRSLSKKDKNRNSAWTLLKDDVFRSPCNGTLLSSLIGFGVQILVILVLTLIFALVVLKPPEYQGSVLYFALVFFGLLGLLSGYISGRFYKRFGGQKWSDSALCTFAIPGVFLMLVLLMNEIFKINKSSGALSFNSISFLLELLFFVVLPLNFLGTSLGFYKRQAEVYVSAIPREIPVSPILARRIPGILLCGLFPFLFIYINLSSIKYAFSTSDYPILFLMLFLEVIICAECTILFCYDHLRVLDYNWWWRSFLGSGCVSLYMLFYCFTGSLVYEDTDSIILYIGYTIMGLLLLFLTTGTVGFLACYWFINRLYGNADQNVGYYNVNLSVGVKPTEKTKDNLLVKECEKFSNFL